MLGACGIVIGAAGSHAGGGDLARLASLYLLIHAAAVFGIVATALALPRLSIWLGAAASMLSVGVAAFAGDLALLAFAGSHVASWLAPIGGLLMIVGWLTAAAAPLASRR